MLRQFPQVRHDLQFFLAHYSSAYEVDRSAGANPIRQPLDNLSEAGSLYGPIVYEKSPVFGAKVASFDATKALASKIAAGPPLAQQAIKRSFRRLETLGKPVGQDAEHHRPSAAADLGLVGALQHFQGLMQRAVDSVPDCPARDALRRLVRAESERLVPQVACDQVLRSARVAATGVA